MNYELNIFQQLGQRLSSLQWVEEHFGEAIEQQYRENSWFTPEFCRYALSAIAKMLAPEALEAYHNHYKDIAPTTAARKRVAVISAGNIPMAAFHDFFCILVSGNDYQGKLSSQDKRLLPILAQELIHIEPKFAERITFVDRIANFDAVIATGSNNSSRYFSYYFDKYPHILRKNRNSVAILDGSETEEELRFLAHDIYLYFGLGCRSISKLFVPKDYDFVPFLHILTQESQPIALHHQFNNNLDYQKAVHLMNQIPYMDAGTFLLVENQNYTSPIGMLYYEYYDDLNPIKQRLTTDSDQLQCIVGHSASPFGSAQNPSLLDYPDGVDVLAWLLTCDV